MRIGLVGLGRMGSGMAGRLRGAGHEVVGYDRDPDASEVGSLDELVGRLAPPRAVWSMVPAGEPTRSVIRSLGELLDRGDLVVDGANSRYQEAAGHAERLAERGIGFVDVGVSGGIWGPTDGYCLMVGGSDEHVALLRPVLEALSPADGGLAHVGGVGVGHFTKMVHNGVEYALMQAYAEGYEVLLRSDVDVDVHAALEGWRHGSVVRSWLLDRLVDVLADDVELNAIRGHVEDSGTGRWTVQEAVRLGVPVPAITAALYARFSSREPDAPADRALAALRKAFGGHEVEPR